MEVGVRSRLVSLVGRARWLLPWACVLMLSGAIAHAAEQALSTTTLLVEPRVERVPDGLAPARAPAPAGSHWVTIASVDAQGMPSSITCLTRVELMSADVIGVPLEGLDLLVSQLCSAISR
jgi:hypothetical protein